MSHVTELSQPLFLPVGQEIRAYIGNIRRFERSDWVRYVLWIGTIASLLVGTTFFTIWGATHGVVYPGYVWFVPFGTALFVGALAVDDIGHRTLYKEDLRKGEAYIHQMIVGTAVPSVIFLCFCYENPETYRMPAFAFICLSLFYSALDEACHWVRYMKKGIDRVEMWSHFVAIVGHVVMITSWWQWYRAGYPGVAETFATMPF